MNRVSLLTIVFFMLPFIAGARGPCEDWEFESLESVIGGGKELGLTVDSEGNPHAVHKTWSGEIFHLTKKDGVWSKEKVGLSVDNEWVEPVAIGIDSSDKLHLSYFRLPNLINYFIKPKGGRWEIEHSFNRAGGYYNMAVDPDGTAHFAYGLYDGPFYITSKGWKFFDLLPGDELNYRYPSLVRDEMGNTHFAYVASYGPNSALRYTYLNPETKETKTEIVRVPDYGLYAPTVALMKNGQPLIMYTERYDMYVAQRNESGEWKINKLGIQLTMQQIAIEKDRLGQFHALFNGYKDGSGRVHSLHYFFSPDGNEWTHKVLQENSNFGKVGATLWKDELRILSLQNQTLQYGRCHSPIGPNRYGSYDPYLLGPMGE